MFLYSGSQWGPKQHWKQSHKDLEQHELLKTELTFLGKLSL